MEESYLTRRDREVFKSVKVSEREAISKTTAAAQKSFDGVKDQREDKRWRVVVLFFLDLFFLFCVLFLEGSGGAVRKKGEGKDTKQNN